jgi:broad specificity phosphatase PhoE
MTAPLADGAQVWLLRHGETEWSKSGQHTGRTELELTGPGRAQAIGLRPLFASLHPSLVLCSPRIRAQQTAALAGLSVDAIDPDLAEWDYGEYEGLTSEQIHQRDPDWTIFTGFTPGGETSAQVQARADRVLERARTCLTDQPGAPVILVGHGHINRVLGVRWIELPVAAGGSFALGTAATCVLGAEHGGPVIDHWNVAHPSEPEAT